MVNDLEEFGFKDPEEVDLPQDRLIDIIATHPEIRERLDPAFEVRDMRDCPRSFNEKFMDDNLDFKMKSYIRGEDPEKLNSKIKTAFKELYASKWNSLDDGGFI